MKEAEKSDWNKLQRAITANNVEEVQLLLVELPKLLDAVGNVGNTGWTALHYAAHKGHAKIAEILIAKNSKLLDAVDNDGKTALHTATFAVFLNDRDKVKVIDLLITKSPKLLDAVDNNGKTALHYAAQCGDEKTAEMLITKSPKLLDAVDNNGKTALHYATEYHQNHEKIVQILSKAKNDLVSQPKDLKVEENKIANKSDQENKKSYYSKEKIDKLLYSHKVLLSKSQGIGGHLGSLDLSPEQVPISLAQLDSYLAGVIQGNETVALALHLHGETWASLVMKHTGDGNLQLIYNDPTGNAFSKEPAVHKLISILTEKNQNGGTNIIDLRKIQQHTESDSGAIVINNLFKLTASKSLKKAELQKLLLGPEEVNELKTKHSLIEETSPNYSYYERAHYSDCKLAKLLELSLKDKPVLIAPISSFEDEVSLTENITTAVRQIMDIGVSIVIPLSAQGKNWSGLVIKNQSDGSLQIIYSNPTGNSLKVEKNSMTLIKAIMDLNSDVHIIDLQYKQNNKKHESGSFTVNNLIKLALSDTPNFHTKDFHKLLSTTENIDQLRQQHDRLLNDYIMPSLTPEVDAAALVIRQEFEPFEHKGDNPEGKEEYVAPPSYGEEDNPVQMHILGENPEA